MFSKVYFPKIKALYKQHERWLTPVFFGLGFIWDNFTLRVDLWWQNLQFLLYLAAAGTSITLINAAQVGRLRGRFAQRTARFAPYIFQFMFGGLFSAFLVFYSRSASLVTSWPFLLFIAFFFIGNEVFRKKYYLFTFQVSIFFTALFSYAVFSLPLLIGKMGDLIFIASGILALAGIAAILFVFHRIMPIRLEHNKRALIISIASIYLLFQIFYFTNLIPPAPLALKESGVYHSLSSQRLGNYIYKVSYEPAPWYLFFREQSSTVHWTADERLYFYSAIFAPTKFTLPIYHRWMYFDATSDKWIEKSRINFSVSGGRDGGYRGYTFKQGLASGKWRVEVVTQNGKILGRRSFKVVQSALVPDMKTGFK